MGTIDYDVKKLVINIMSNEEYSKVQNPNPDELYFTEAGSDAIKKVVGTISSPSSTIPLGTTLNSADQILYVNLDMGIALPSTYSLSSNKNSIVFQEELETGTKYCIAYLIADIQSVDFVTKTELNNKFQVVSELPANPDENTFYFIPEE